MKEIKKQLETSSHITIGEARIEKEIIDGFELAVIYVNDERIAERGLNCNYIAYNKAKVNTLANDKINDLLVNRELISNPLEEEKLIDIRPEYDHWYSKQFQNKYLNIPFDECGFDTRYEYKHYDNSNYSLD